MAVLFGLGIGLGFMPAIHAGTGIRSWAFERFTSRSMAVIDALEQYVQATGAPPASLSDLVPTYLAAVPKTGMAVYPNYEYSARPDECSIKSKWHLWVNVREFIDMNQLLYCPAQDYEPRPQYVLSRTAVGTWVHDRIDF